MYSRTTPLGIRGGSQLRVTVEPMILVAVTLRGGDGAEGIKKFMFSACGFTASFTHTTPSTETVMYLSECKQVGKKGSVVTTAH